MKENTQIDQIRYDRMLAPLIADFKPVKPIWTAKVRLSMWVLLQAGIMVVAVAGGRRMNVAAKLLDWEFLLGFSGLIILGLAAASTALKAAVPGESEFSNRKLFGLIALGVVAQVLILAEPVHAIGSIHQFVATGSYCMVCTFLLAAGPWAGLFWAVRRAMPLMGGAEGALIGTAAFAFSFAATRLGCPIDDFSHVLIWHAFPAAIGAGVSIAAGALWLDGLKRYRISD
ncbi:MAG TPA: NrsF family protein [Candidatus Binataceae bacterium]|nr:NrsF family protein [Candidatus Binataceae bacterium]